MLSSTLSSPGSGCPVLLTRVTLIPKINCHIIAVPLSQGFCCLSVGFCTADLLVLSMKREGRPLGNFCVNPLEQADKLNVGKL